MTSTLLVGDSQVAGPPGRLLAGLLAGRGPVERLGRVGRGAVSYALPGSPERAELVEGLATRPDRVVYLFGINDPPGPRTEDALRRLRALGRQASPGPVWLVGPPAYPLDEHDAHSAALAVLGSRVFGANFVDSRRLTTRDRDDRTLDRVHFTEAGALPWARSVASILDRGNALAALAVGTVSSLVIGKLWRDVFGG